MLIVSPPKDSHSNSNQTQRAGIVSVDENVNTNKMIQQSVNVQAPPPRLHPKKRKFDLSELEDEQHNNQTVCTTTNTVMSSPIVIPSSTTCATSSNVLYSQQQNGNQMTSSIGSYNNPHITQIVKNSAEGQQLTKRQTFISYR